MNQGISVHPSVEKELSDAVAFYNAENPDLAEDLLDEIERTIGQIRQYPEAAPLVNRLVRRRLMSRFPYSIVYTVTPEVIRILAIAHQKRRPFYWRGRR